MVVGIGSYLAQHRCTPAQAVYIVHREIGLGLVGHSEQMQYRIGRSAHGDVESHGVEHGLTGGYVARKHRCIAVAIPGISVGHDLTGGLAE